MARVLAALLAVAVLGCGPAHGDAWINTMAAAKRAYSAGRYSEAAKAFATAATSAKRLKDRDEALFMQARMLRRMGIDEGAIAVYKKLIASSPRGPRHGRAAFEIAGLTIEKADRVGKTKHIEMYPRLFCALPPDPAEDLLRDLLLLDGG